MVSHFTPWKYHTTSGFLKFLGGNESDQWHDMGYRVIITSGISKSLLFSRSRFANLDMFINEITEKSVLNSVPDDLHR